MIDTNAFHDLSYGLYIVSAKLPDGRFVGCVANTFGQVASDPAKTSISLNKENTTTKAIQETGRLCISVLNESADMELIGKFGFNSSLDTEKFEGIEFELTDDGIPYVTQMSDAVFELEVEEAVDVGSHLLFVCDVLSANTIESEFPPMTYAYYHMVLKGRTPPRAATYVTKDSDFAEPGGSTAKAEDSPENIGDGPTIEVVEEIVTDGPKVGWQCSLCGYIVEMEELPDDFHCPICGADKSFFVKIEL